MKRRALVALLTLATAACTSSTVDTPNQPAATASKIAAGEVVRIDEPASFAPMLEVIIRSGLGPCGGDAKDEYTGLYSLQVDALGVVRRSAEGCTAVTWHHAPIPLVDALEDRSTGPLGVAAACESEWDGTDVEIVWLDDGARRRSCGPGELLNANTANAAYALLDATAGRP